MIEFDLNKKGIIILSHYRSGGTQLLQILEKVVIDQGVIPFTCGEIDTSFQNHSLEYSLRQIYGIYEDRFKIYLLNNPIAIASLNASNQFSKLSKDYNIIHLYRKNIANGILSLGVWEEFIKAGLFKDRNLWTEENMLNFHNQLLVNPIPFQNLTLGISSDIFDSGSTIEMFNFKCMLFSNQLSLNRFIAKEYGLQQIFYEEYETNPESFIENRLDYIKEPTKTAIRGTYKWKIPYTTNNYLDYYDKVTNLHLKQWELVNL